jgi:hypothetical protein
MHPWSPFTSRGFGEADLCVCFRIIDSWLRSQHFRISQMTNAHGLFSVWRSVRATKRYRPFLFLCTSRTVPLVIFRRTLSFDISSSARSRTRLPPPCVRSARKNIMNSHVSTHLSPGSSSAVCHKVRVHRPKKLQTLWKKRSPRPWRILQTRRQPVSPQFRVSPRTSSLR